MISPKERFLSKIQMTPAGCAEWTASRNHGYGVLIIGSRKDGTRRLVRAHRFAYESFIGPIPEGVEIDHLCGNPSCVGVTPEGVVLGHLKLVSHRENMRHGPNSFASTNIKKTHCPKGHPYDEGNTYIHRGKRFCRICRAEAHRKRHRTNRPHLWRLI